MTDRVVIGGVAFSTPMEMRGIARDGFSDVDIDVQWVGSEDVPTSEPLLAPPDQPLWVDIDHHSVTLPLFTDSDQFRSWQLRQVAPIVSSCFERLVLHASAVRLQSGVIAFSGASEAGKSTLAWALVKAGAGVASDDLLPVRWDSGPVVPIDEHARDPLRAICFLQRRSAVLDIQALTGREALQMHVKNGFGEHGRSETWSFQFDSYLRLVSTTTHWQLTIPDDRERLPEVVDALTRQFGDV